MAGGVLRPTALPLALLGSMIPARGIFGRLAFAVASFAVLASATSAPVKLFHETS
jgi:hypothetical protein